MNQFEVTIRLTTYSEIPEEWLIDTIDAALEEDESIDYMNVRTISPVWIRGMEFPSKQDALLYCQTQGLSPTLIHNKATKDKNEQETETR